MGFEKRTKHWRQNDAGPVGHTVAAGEILHLELSMRFERRQCARPASLSLLLLFVAVPVFGQRERKITQLAEGVYEIQHEPNGNTTVILGDRQVFVVDSCFLHSAAREDISQIWKWTDKPVSFVLNTHFHNDHNLGNRVYMDAFPALTIIAHAETKRDMDRFGPGSLMREEKTRSRILQMQNSGKGPDGKELSEDDKKQLTDALSRHDSVIAELKDSPFQSATLTFDHDFNIDLGNREVQVKFLGRGNTSGDAVVYLPKEKIVITGDLVVYPIPYFYDGYPVEWIQTLQNLAELDAGTIVPGHGPILHEKTHIYLIRDLLKSAVDQMNEKLRQTAPAFFQNLDDVKDAVDLTSFRQRFSGDDKDLGAEFDDEASHLVKLVFEEASLR
jgi:glyoxylase-like metal-dependent hydrolase (beta-lactamase superfamily II)